MLGEELRRRREEKELSLGEISEKTNIGTRFLKAIETENYSSLPGGLFTRSFIRTYAKHVGMDPEEAVAMYQTESGTTEQPQSDGSENLVKVPDVPLEEPSYALMKSAIAASLGAVVLVYGGWKAYEYLARPSASSPVASASPEPGQAQPDGQAAAEPAAPVQAAAATQPVSLDGGLTLTLEATDECWIGYKADTGVREQFRLTAGETKTIAATESIDLSVGNTRAVNIRINNRDARFPENTPVVLKKLTITPATASALIQ